MIDYIIIEDEPAALRRLKRKLIELRPDWNFKGSADSVDSGIRLIRETKFDLILSDIELSDGTSFEIFKRFESTLPIIFITAFDEYALKAFDYNSIHYLLKPIIVQKLMAALEKFESNPGLFSQASNFYADTSEDLLKKLVSRVGTKSTIIDQEKIAYFYHAERITKAYLSSGTVHMLDHSLDALMEYISKVSFFRINRQTIVQRSNILGYTRIKSNRLLLQTKSETPFDLIVSKEKNRSFREWLSE